MGCRPAGLRFLTDDRIEALHVATLEVLERTGILVEDEAALDIFSDGGCAADRATHMVRIPGAVAAACLGLVSPQLTLGGREPKRDVVLDGESVYFSNHCEASHVNDWRSGEHRPSIKQDVADAARLVDCLSDIDVFVAPVIAGDRLQAAAAHQYAAAVANTTKPIHALVSNGHETEAIVEIAAAVAGGRDRLRERPIVSVGPCPVPPLQLTREFTEALLVCVRSGVPIMPMVMPIVGATGPATLAGTLVACNALEVASMTLAQLAERGAKAWTGWGSSSMDMRTGLMTGGSPEMTLLGCGGAELARHYGIPCQVAAMWSDSHVSDGQSAHQKTLGGLASALAGADLIQGAGGLDCGVTFDWAELAADNEICHAIRHVAAGIEVTETTLMVDEIDAVGPFGEFLSRASTLRHMHELSDPVFFDRRPRELWLEDPSDLAGRGRAEARLLLEEHEPEPLPEEVTDLIEAVLSKAEVGARRR